MINLKVDTDTKSIETYKDLYSVILYLVREYQFELNPDQFIALSILNNITTLYEDTFNYSNFYLEVITNYFEDYLSIDNIGIYLFGLNTPVIWNTFFNVAINEFFKEKKG